MSQVLRGGKWGRVQSRGAANSGQRSSTHSDLTREGNHEDEVVNETILSFAQEKRIMAVASFDVDSKEIHVSRLSSAKDYEDVNRIVSSFEVCHIVLPQTCKENDAFLSALMQAKRLGGYGDHEDSENEKNGIPSPQEESMERSNESVTISFLSNQHFGTRKAYEVCSLLFVSGMPQNATSDQRMGFLSHAFGHESCILRAVGGLVSYVLQKGILRSNVGDDLVQISDLKYRNFVECMSISPITLRALHVFENDLHPVGRGGMKGKEGLSIYGIFKSHLKTATGRKRLREWIYFPCTDLSTIHERQTVVRSMCSPANHAFLATLKDALRGIRSVQNVLIRLRQACVNLSDWKTLRSSAKSFVMVFETLKVAVQYDSRLLGSELIEKVKEVNEEHLRETVNWIDAVVDFEESQKQCRMTVMHGFSDEIDEQKHIYAGLDEFLLRVGVQERRTLEENGISLEPSSFDFTFEAQIGFMITIHEEDVLRIGQGELEKNGLSSLYSSAQTVFFKNEKCRELDEDPGDLHGTICDLEAKALRYLEGKIFDFEESLFKMARIATELDCLQAFASAATENTWTMPTFHESNSFLDIVEGRHPLIEQTVPSFIPNCTKIKSGDVQVITGPNYSGKSAYISQVALNVILAQIGSCVPAKQARMILFTHINCRVNSFESISTRRCSFFTDASQITPMLFEGEGKALNLIDEFGKGTDEVSGMTLLASSLRRLLGHNPSSGVTLCATHFYEILKKPFLPTSDPRLRIFSMEITTNLAVGLDESERRSTISRPRKRRNTVGSGNIREETGASQQALTANAEMDTLGNAFVRTYRLIEGTMCHEARAIQCALEAGVPKANLERAAHIRANKIDGKVADPVPAPSRNARMMSLVRTMRAFLAEDKQFDK